MSEIVFVCARDAWQLMHCISVTIELSPVSIGRLITIKCTPLLCHAAHRARAHRSINTNTIVFRIDVCASFNESLHNGGVPTLGGLHDGSLALHSSDTMWRCGVH